MSEVQAAHWLMARLCEQAAHWLMAQLCEQAGAQKMYLVRG